MGINTDRNKQTDIRQVQTDFTHSIICFSDKGIFFFRFILLPFTLWADKDIDRSETAGMVRYTLFAFKMSLLRINLIINCLLRQGL